MGFLKWLLRKKLWEKGWFFLKENGISEALRRLWALLRERINEISKLDNETRYRYWWKSQRMTEKRKEKIKKKIKEFKYSPTISILVPVFNTPPQFLEKCFRSAENQIYSNWQLCIVDDASTLKQTIGVLRKWKKKSKTDSRFIIHRQKKGKHISLTTNQCLKFAKGEFVTLLDHDDELHPVALYLVAKHLNNNPDTDFIYSDEDKLGREGEHCNPYFKPDWSPDLLLSNNYICHLAVIRKSIMEKLGGMKKGFEGAQDYDLFLRVAEVTKKIVHIPYILYHWRKIPGSTADIYQAKNYADVKAVKALKSAMNRRGIIGKVEKGMVGSSFRVRYHIKDPKEVAIIIPFKDKVEMLEKCVESILEKTEYSNYKILLVDNQSEEEKTREYLEKVKKLPHVKILSYPKPFNFSAINNWAVKQTEAPYVLFLNNDTEVISKGWLTAMAEHIQRDEVGIIGARLFYPNDKIQHAGVILGTGKYKDKSCGVAGHSHKYFPRHSMGYVNWVNFIRNYSAVTAACMLTKRKLFEEVDGFDEKNFTVTWNDIDYCLKVRKKRYLIVYTPFAELYHYESVSRGSDDKPEVLDRFHKETDKMYEKWEKELSNDPYYNPNLSKRDESFRIKKKAVDIYE